MMTLSSSKLSVWLARLVWVALLWVTLFTPRSYGSEAGSASGTESIAVALSLEEVEYTFMNLGVSFDARLEPFPQEPVADGTIHRGTLRFSGNRTNAMTFLWQRSDGTLFLDLNRNQDLTDDPAGVFTAHEGMSPRHQTFTGVRLPLVESPGGRTQLVDLNFWYYGERLNVSAALRSFWQGRLILNDTEWQVGVVQDLFGESGRPNSLLLRPWQERDQPFNVGSDGSLDALNFPQKVFVGDRLYRCEFGDAQTDRDSAGLQFIGEAVELGELQVTGQFIHRLVLDGGSQLVVLDQPAGSVQVPVGAYTGVKVGLRQGSGEAFREAARGPRSAQLVVKADHPAVLVAGGPLTNSLLVMRRGRNLMLSYRLLGADGDSYQLAAADRSNPPRFTVFRGDAQIDSGKFEYG